MPHTSSNSQQISATYLIPVNSQETSATHLIPAHPNQNISLLHRAEFTPDSALPFNSDKSSALHTFPQVSTLADTTHSQNILLPTSSNGTQTAEVVTGLG